MPTNNQNHDTQPDLQIVGERKRQSLNICLGESALGPP